MFHDTLRARGSSPASPSLQSLLLCNPRCIQRRLVADIVIFAVRSAMQAPIRRMGAAACRGWKHVIP